MVFGMFVPEEYNVLTIGFNRGLEALRSCKMEFTKALQILHTLVTIVKYGKYPLPCLRFDLRFTET